MEPRQVNTFAAFVLGLAIAIGLLGAGYFSAKAIYKAKALDRFVTVKGLAERDVKADLGIWQINYREIGNNLIDVNKQVQHDQEVVVTFLKQNGFTPDEIEFRAPKVIDQLADTSYSQPSNIQPGMQNRYIIAGGVRIRSTRIDLMQKVSQMDNTLLQQGIPLSFNDNSGTPNPSYYFTQLDSIRPAMLADATHSARKIAEQFALDSGSKLGNIRHASQGVFQIMSRDTSTQNDDWNNNQNALGSINKKIRLVTTIDYFLAK